MPASQTIEAQELAQRLAASPRLLLATLQSLMALSPFSLKIRLTDFCEGTINVPIDTIELRAGGIVVSNSNYIG